MKSFKQFICEGELNEEYLLLEKVAQKFSADIESIKPMIKKSLKLKDSDFKRVSANRLAILTDSNRQKVLENIANELAPLGWKYKTNTKVSSIGHVEYNNSIIFVKPKSRQGLASAGVDNEQILISGINEYIKENGGEITVTFTSGRKKTTHKDIVKVIDVGRDASARKKADIVMVNTKGKEIPISIKKDGAEIWESADQYWGENAGKFIKQLLKDKKIKMELQNAGYYKITPNFAVKANKKEVRDVVFGSDILAKKGAIVEKTFRPNDFFYNGDKNELVIKVSNVIVNESDISGRDIPWFLVRNDSTRKIKAIGYDGIRVLSVFESRINKNVLRVNRNII